MMPDLDPKCLLKRFKRAETERAPWDALLREAYAFAAPDFDSGFQSLGGTPGRDRRSRLFDSTALQAVEDGASAVQQTLTPATEVFLRIEPTASALAALRDAGGEEGVAAVRLVNDQITQVFFEHLNSSNFHEVVAGAYVQEAISTGILVMNEAPSGSPSAFQFEVVPQFDVYPEQAPGSQWRTVWRRLKRSPASIQQTWPNASLPPAIERLVNERPDDEIDLLDGAVYDWDKDRYTYVVLWPGDDAALLLHQEQDTSPFLEFRSQVAPGEMLGRGRVLGVLPDIKTANKVVELVLKNASIAVTGIWQADDDGVINPATIKLVPGAIIPKAVGSSGLTPLETPGRFDVSEMLLGDLRNRIRLAIVGPELPAMERRRDVTATEMDYRAGEVQLLRAPRLLRLWPTVVRMVLRGIGILQRRGDIPDMPGIGTKFRMMPVSRMLQMQHLADVMRARSAIGIAAEMFPQALARVVDAEQSCEWVLRKGGLPEELFSTPQERAAAAQAESQNAELARAAELANRAAPMVKALQPAAAPAAAEMPVAAA